MKKENVELFNSNPRLQKCIIGKENKFVHCTATIYLNNINKNHCLEDVTTTVQWYNHVYANGNDVLFTLF